MDNVTHAAIGVGVFATYMTMGVEPTSTPVVAATCIAAVLGAEAPDVDIIFQYIGGPIPYLYQHRQISHSFPLWFFYALASGLIVDLFVPGHFWLYTALAFVGVLTHVGTDMLTSYGTQAFWPISSTRWRGDVLFVVEPIYIILFIIGFALIEYGSAFNWTVWVLDLVAVGYTLWRTLIRLWLGSDMRRYVRQYGDPRSAKWRLTPTLFPVLHGYKYVVQIGDHFHFGSFDWRGRAHEESRLKSEHSPAVEFALRHSKVGKALARFSPMLLAQMESDGQWVVVRLADATVRYFDRLPFSGVVDLLPTVHGDYALVQEGLRAQPVDIQKLWHDTFSPVGERAVPQIPSPRGYRSKSRV
ncbi:metal-dependent hydrolase [Alicyclobacillus fodiniaquatilis]|uniref:Metal-dependent hydrolase n=1 Tax=Alicyclobacillus fodiniaquatilis TaxID=1661150 RepID=A0ABW4JPC8_9BACL